MTEQKMIARFAVTVEDLEKIGVVEFSGVAQADFYLLFLPARKISFMAMGVVLATLLPVYVYSEEEQASDLSQTSTFFYAKGTVDFRIKRSPY